MRNPDWNPRKSARKAKLKMRFKGDRLAREISKTVEKLALLREIAADNSVESGEG